MKKIDKLVVASHNLGKIKEIRELLEGFDVNVLSARELDLIEPEETGTTFEENALIKAKSAAELSGISALSDDSGLCIEGLNGEPGIYSARWAGQERDFLRAMRIIEEKLQQSGFINAEQRKAYFIAVLCLYHPSGEYSFFEGKVNGHIVWPPRGEKGFGYDPVFQPVGYDITFGEMDSEQKHGNKEQKGLSHRSRAFQKLAKIF